MLESVLEQYLFKNPTTELLRHNENMTYLVTDEGIKYILRIHKPVEGFNLGLLRMGIEQEAFVKSEIELLEDLSEHKHLGTQRVIRNKLQQAVTVLEDGTLATVISWLEGTTLEDTEITEETAYQVGQMIGNVQKAMQNSKIQNRYVYGKELLDELKKEAGHAIQNGHFRENHGRIILDTLSLIGEELGKNESRFLLVHSDLSKSNLIQTKDKIIPIDFSLSGYSVPEMDIASLYSHFPEAEQQKAILTGYQSVSDIELQEDLIEICLCLQILLFVVCQNDKMYAEEWFQECLQRWCDTVFQPCLEYH